MLTLCTLEIADFELEYFLENDVCRRHCRVHFRQLEQDIAQKIVRTQLEYLKVSSCEIFPADKLSSRMSRGKCSYMGINNKQHDLVLLAARGC